MFYKMRNTYVLTGIELIKGLIFLHLDFFKAFSKPLKLRILNNLGFFIGFLKDGSCFLCSFCGGYFLKLLIGDCTK